MSAAAIGLLFTGGVTYAEDDEESSEFLIDRALWSSGNPRLYLKIKAKKTQIIQVENAYDSGQVLLREQLSEDELKITLSDPQPIPCRIRAINETTGEVRERDVRDRSTHTIPANCSPQDATDPPPVNQAPVANAGTDKTIVLNPGQASIDVILDGSGSNDPDGSIASYSWTGLPDPADVASPTVTLGVGTHLFSLEVTDNDGAVSQTDSVAITIEETPAVNQPPVANAGSDEVIVLPDGQFSTNVILDGSGSNDPDGSIASYNWSGSPDPANVVNPTLTLGVGTHLFSLLVTDNDGAVSQVDSVAITIETTLVGNQPPIANAGPDQMFTLASGESTVTVWLDGSASNDPDGSISNYLWTGTPDPDDIINPSFALGVGTYNFTLTVRDDKGLESTADIVQITINPFPTTALEAHATIAVYEGPGTCIACHEAAAEQMHGSVHYQQTGPAINLTNIFATPENPDGLAGERGNGAIGINTYCGTHENSPRFTCAGCHVGNGRFPNPELPATEPERTEELANIDCMMCHQELYKRFPTGEFEALTMIPQGADGFPDLSADPIVLTGTSGIPVVDPITKDFLFEPADAESALSTPLMISRHEAARTVHRTTRKSCLNCHAKAGGADGTKRGDISSLLADPTPQIDIHMSSSGFDLTCANCHDAGGHRMSGRGLDLRPNDDPQRFSCESCHDQPHGDYSNITGSSRDKHASRVACQTCHIPTYAKGMPTEVSRDWENPHFSAAACNGRGGWLPEEIKASDLIPTYNWFDGTSRVYVLGESLNDYLLPNALPDGSDAYSLAQPNGAVDSSGSKIYPMKEHVSKSAMHLDTNQLVAHSTFEFFRTGSFDTAVQSALEQEGRAGDAYRVVPVHTYQTINHGVESSVAALECGDCHGDAGLAGGPARMNLQADMGYELKGPETSVCSQCHGTESSEGFVKNHQRHVENKGYDCSVCHTFSRPERGLKMSK